MEFDVKICKMITGEEIIGNITKFEDGVLYIKKPLAIGINHQEGKLVFVPYMPYTSAVEEVLLPSSSLLHEPLAPVESLVNDYLEATEQKVKIFVPGKNIVRPVQ